MEMNDLVKKRHTLAHLLAAAVLEHYPDTKLTLGPAIDTGFYYDMEFAKPLTDTELPKIEETMKKLLSGWTEFTHREVSSTRAKTDSG
jgi:threonyl-tRNA synthetase